MKVLTQRNINITFLVVLLVCIDDKFSKPIVAFRCENDAYEFIKEIFKEYGYCKNVMKKQFKKNLIMSEKEQETFQLINVNWICKT